MYVSQLPFEEQEVIRIKLERAGLTSEEIQDAMDSKLSDLEDTI